MSSQFDSFGKQLKEIILSITELKNENKRITEENLKIKKELNTISNRVNILEQKALECHIEIFGIPESKNENYTDTFEKINIKLGTKISVNNIYRIPSKFSDKPRKISIIFNSLAEKNEFMKQAKKEKLIAKNFDASWNNSPVYFNNLMTYSNKTLFYKAKTTA